MVCSSLIQTKIVSSVSVVAHGIIWEIFELRFRISLENNTWCEQSHPLIKGSETIMTLMTQKGPQAI